MKKTFSLTAALMLHLFANAQFELSTGIGLAIAPGKTQHFSYVSSYSSTPDTVYQSYKVSGGGFGVFVYPKIHLFQAAQHSLSVGAPIMLGFSGSANSQEGGTMSFLYDFNISADINGGRLNRKNGDSKDKRFGYFFGLGVGAINTSEAGYELTEPSSYTPKSGASYTMVNDNNEIYDKMTVKNVGFFVHAGSTIALGRNGNTNAGLRFFFKPGLGSTAPSYFGLNAFFNFGKYAENSSRSRSKGSRSSSSRSKSRSSSGRRR